MEEINLRRKESNKMAPYGEEARPLRMTEMEAQKRTSMNMEGSMNVEVAAKTRETITRRRYLRLVQVAMEISSVLDRNHIERHEGCVVRQLVEELWRMEK